MEIIYGDITKANADVIVNAANGLGFMGGIFGRLSKLPGVAESIHYRTRGIVEKEAKKKSRKIKWIPSLFRGHKSGELYVTSAGNLSAFWIIHAVTMPYPGMRTSLQTVRSLLPMIVQEAKLLNASSVAIPLLGTGTGGLNVEDVLSIYTEVLSSVEEIEIVIYIKH
jgi:O-acetyl-ADP-ribose deacetylase (regulator of RNase III)